MKVIEKLWTHQQNTAGILTVQNRISPATTVLIYSGTDILNTTKVGDYMNESSRV